MVLVKKPQIVVEKLPAKKSPERRQEFPRQSVNYLEIIENKDKIRPQVVNKNFSPDDALAIDKQRDMYPIPEFSQDFIHLNAPIPVVEETPPPSDTEDNTSLSDEKISDEFSFFNPKPNDEDIKENFEETKQSIDSDFETKSIDMDELSFRDKDSDAESVYKHVDSDDEKKLFDSDDDLFVKSDEDEYIKEVIKSDDDLFVKSDDDDIFVEDKPSKKSAGHKSKLQQLLADSDDDSDTSQSKSVKRSANRFIPRSQQRIRNIRSEAPSMAALEAEGQYTGKKIIVDAEHFDSTPQPTLEDIDEKKRELLFKFELLKKSYKTTEMPEFSIHSDYRQMEISYEATLKRLSLENNVDNYKNYLIGGFMLTEFVLGKFLKLDMEGFSQQQIMSMHSYEKLLIELGEKNYVPEDKKWPVEFRLIGLIVMNAAIFVVSKMIMKKSGSNLLGMFNNMNKGGGSSGGGAPQAKKRKMRGPTVNLDDLPDV